MCMCTPEKRTMFCGKPGCEMPAQLTQKDEGYKSVTFSLTITKRLNDWLKAKANGLGVSKNAQIIFLLEQIMTDSQEVENGTQAGSDKTST